MNKLKGKETNLTSNETKEKWKKNKYRIKFRHKCRFMSHFINYTANINYQYCYLVHFGKMYESFLWFLYLYDLGSLSPPYLQFITPHCLIQNQELFNLLRLDMHLHSGRGSRGWTPPHCGCWCRSPGGQSAAAPQGRCQEAGTSDRCAGNLYTRSRGVVRGGSEGRMEELGAKNEEKCKNQIIRGEIKRWQGEVKAGGMMKRWKRGGRGEKTASWRYSWVQVQQCHDYEKWFTKPHCRHL